MSPGERYPRAFAAEEVSEPEGAVQLTIGDGTSGRLDIPPHAPRHSHPTARIGRRRRMGTSFATCRLRQTLFLPEFRDVALDVVQQLGDPPGVVVLHEFVERLELGFGRVHEVERDAFLAELDHFVGVGHDRDLFARHHAVRLASRWTTPRPTPPSAWSAQAAIKGRRRSSRSPRA